MQDFVLHTKFRWKIWCLSKIRVHISCPCGLVATKQNGGTSLSFRKFSMRARYTQKGMRRIQANVCYTCAFSLVATRHIQQAAYIIQSQLKLLSRIHKYNFAYDVYCTYMLHYLCTFSLSFLLHILNFHAPKSSSRKAHVR